MLNTKIIQNKIYEIQICLKQKNYLTAENICENILSYIKTADDKRKESIKKTNINAARYLAKDAFRLAEEKTSQSEFNKWLSDPKRYEDFI